MSKIRLGATHDEALEMVKDAIAGCLEVRFEMGMPLTIETARAAVTSS
ncbi:MAG: type II toxin-antitoxin system HicB family antitoxin [bacterium]